MGTKRKSIIRTEQLPKIQDTGCLYAPSCLNCPFEDCLEDLTHTERQGLIKKLKEKEDERPRRTT